MKPAQTLTKAQLILHLMATLNIKRTVAKTIVDDFFEQIMHTLADGDCVKLSGFGKFVLHDKKARPGRNLKTGEVVQITPRRVVRFKAGQKLKERIASYQDVVDI